MNMNKYQSMSNTAEISTLHMGKTDDVYQTQNTSLIMKICCSKREKKDIKVWSFWILSHLVQILLSIKRGCTLESEINVPVRLLILKDFPTRMALISDRTFIRF